MIPAGFHHLFSYHLPRKSNINCKKDYFTFHQSSKFPFKLCCRLFLSWIACIYPAQKFGIMPQYYGMLPLCFLLDISSLFVGHPLHYVIEYTNSGFKCFWFPCNWILKVLFLKQMTAFYKDSRVIFTFKKMVGTSFTVINWVLLLIVDHLHMQSEG